MNGDGVNALILCWKHSALLTDDVVLRVRMYPISARREKAPCVPSRNSETVENASLCHDNFVSGIRSKRII